MKRLIAALSSGVLLGSVALPVAADTALFDADALNHSTPYERGVNYRSFRGVPLSATSGNPVGSDGRGFNDQSPSQFKTVLGAGGSVHPGPANTAKLFKGNTSPTSYEGNAATLGLPRNAAGSGVVLSRAVMAAPYFSRSTSLKFGSILRPPDTDETGKVITGVRPEDYWRPEPVGHTDDPVADRYYWSPHAAVVFATQPGPINIRWRKANPEPTPVDNAAGRVSAGTLVSDSGLYFAVTNVAYVVSGAAEKTPKTLFWTEGDFQKVGKVVAVPESKVSVVNLVFNSAFPKQVALADVYVAPGQGAGLVNSNTYRNTVWVENRGIHANNAEGRVFVELLGESLPGGNRRFLGMEVVDVLQFAQPARVPVDLGDPVGPDADGANPEGLHPEFVYQGQDSLRYLFQQASPSGGDSTFHAAYATEGPNDALLHWMRDGEAGLRWPQLLASYQIDWPTDPARFEHFVRPEAGSVVEASRTAVPLPSGSVPAISYQDALDTTRGFLTSAGAYYTYLDATQPVHRGLLRFQKENSVAFTRVLSWLDAGLKSPLSALVGTSVTNLTAWNLAAPLSAVDFRDLGAFATQLKTPGDGYSAYLKTRLSSGTLTAINSFLASGTDANRSTLVAGLVTDLTRVLTEPSRILPAVQGNVLAATPSGTQNWKSLAVSADGRKLVGAVYGGQLYTSTDSGLNWTARDSARNWQSVASSSDGVKLVAVVSGGYVYTSSNSGATWVQKDAARSWTSVASSSDGSKLVASVSAGQVYTSTDGGGSWTARDSARLWTSVASNADGTRLKAAVSGGGLYVSTDSGATWKVSGLGNWGSLASSTDGTRWVAASYLGNLYTSADSGLSWTARSSAQGWNKVASSADGTKLVATVYGGQIHTSTDAGVTWTPRESARAWNGLASSADGIRLVAACQNGQLYTSADSGITWTARESARSWATVSSAADGTKLVAGDAAGVLYFSANAGVSWSTNGAGAWRSIAASTDGTKVVAAAYNGRLYTSADSGLSWTPRDSVRNWTSVASSSDGAKLVAAVYGGQIYVSTDSGGTWVARDSARNWQSVASSTDGTKLVAVVNSGFVYTSVDSGATWTARTSAGLAYSSVASSSDGSKLVAVVNPGYLYLSSNAGVTWAAKTSTNAVWTSVASSADGTKLVATVSGGQIWASSDSGANWTARASALNWQSVASSTDGTKLVAAVSGGQLWTSSDSGANWAAKDSARNWKAVASSGDGVTVFGVVDAGGIYYSTNTGANWTLSGVASWGSVAMSADGVKMVATTYGGKLYTSTDSGATWATRDSVRNWIAVASSTNGVNLAAVVYGGPIYVSTDSGVTWTARESNRYWSSVSMSADGTKLVAGVGGSTDAGLLYTSTDGGSTWKAVGTATWTGLASASDGLKASAVATSGKIFTTTDGGATWQAQEQARSWTSVASSADGNVLLASVASGDVYYSNDSGVTWSVVPSTVTGTANWQDVAVSSDGKQWLAGNYGGSIHKNYLQFTTIGAASDPFQVNRLALDALYPAELYHSQALITASTLSAPRVVSATVSVGARITAPSDETGAVGSYLAGRLNLAKGDSVDMTAYVDPLVEGFAAANQGAILPVNAIPGKKSLEVWWFRPGKTNSVLNLSNGFPPVYWPSVLGLYTVQWPTSPDEIVLASNDGSGPLPSLQQKGTIYVQNDPTQPGYNPNEEHALMLGGQAYALRDDLNKTGTTSPAVLSGTGTTYSSDPCVLLRYMESDGRPAMHPFKVRREKPEAGIVFDYVVQAGGNEDKSGAGQPLQAPMPLPLLPPPLETVTETRDVWEPANERYNVESYDVVRNWNTETSQASGDLPAGWTTSLTNTHPNYARFTYRDRKNGFWVLRGLHAGLPGLDAGTYNATTKVFTRTLPSAVAVVGQPFTNVLHASRLGLGVALKTGNTAPAGLKVNGLNFEGVPLSESGKSYPWTATLTLVVGDAGDGSSVEVVLPLTVKTSGTVVAQSALTLTATSAQSGSTTTFVGRPPFLASEAKGTNSFSMRFYYLSQEGFAWPGVATPPAVGTVVPYLRPLDGTGQPVGDVATKTGALDIVYRPVWPNNPPKMPFGYTLNGAQFNLPAVRGQTSVEVLYQQSIATNITAAAPNESVVLHDPERAKTYALGATGLAAIPASVRTEVSQGKTYFPSLPPHLAKRFYLDPDASPSGSLTLNGAYQAPGLGAPYLMLNVLGADDLATVKGLCPATDADKARWDAAVDGLSTTLETFVEDPTVKGRYIPGPATQNDVVGIGELSRITNSSTAVVSYALSANGPGQGYVTLVMNNSVNPGQTPAGDPVSVYVIKVGGSLYPGEIQVVPSENPLSELSVFQHSQDLGGKFSDYEYEWKISPGSTAPAITDADKANGTRANYQALVSGTSLPRYILGGSGIQTLVDNWLVMRYRPKNTAHPMYNTWSAWTEPQSAEGWIKRVLAGINPFNQRVSDLYNRTVNTDANVLTSAGKRWEGDIPLNLANINDYGLIEIYETVLKKGRGLSIDAGINFGPANNALMLAAGYLNDLYMLVGNEAYADAANPTIGIGTKDSTYGDVATSLFSFKGQEPSLLEEELALLRGRDDVLDPGVQTAPVYNRLVWNYTRGIDSGEVVYALNYNILDQNNDGKVDASDAAKLFPQGHGDAYGHYLTALKGYYSLLMSGKFSWVPSAETVTVLGKAVAVDYQDERKFAAAATAVGRAGRQVFDLTWRRDYVPGRDVGWEHLSATRVSTRRVKDVTGTVTRSVVREWGADQWASRVQQGSLVNWVVGNAILPAVDPDPSHEGIEKVDRTTVPELKELATLIEGMQGALDTAEGGLTPLGLAEGSLAFDIDPNRVTGANGQTHFEQVYERAKVALGNAVAAFDDAKDVTRRMRSEQDSLEDFQTEYDKQELAYTSALIEVYGTPYPDDVGAGKTWPQGYEGPDLRNYRYVDNPEFINGGPISEDATVDAQGNAANAIWDANGSVGTVFKVDIQTTDKWPVNLTTDNWIVPAFLRDANGDPVENPDYKQGEHYITYTWGPHGFLDKPTTFTGKRKSPGRLQRDISEVIAAYDHLFNALAAVAVSDKEDLDKQVQLFKAKVEFLKAKRENLVSHQQLEAATMAVEKIQELGNMVGDNLKELNATLSDAESKLLPTQFIFGLASGGDISRPAEGAVKLAHAGVLVALQSFQMIGNITADATLGALSSEIAKLDLSDFDLESKAELQQASYELGLGIKQVQAAFIGINEDTRRLQDAYEDYRRDLAAGDRLQVEREVFRKRAAAVVQGFRTRDAAFRIFRNEKLERYKSLFDLASRYSYLAATAYDYETGLLGTDAGKEFLGRIIGSRSLGVMKNGDPQYAGSNTGDPGLSSALAEMKADWDVLRGRLGFNNPDSYGTTVSFRQENLRILPGVDGDVVWQDKLRQSQRDDLLLDADVRKHCLQIDTGSGLPVPGIVLEFSTSIEPGKNLFGLPLAAGDSYFDRSSFATKIFAAGVALEGYVGMNNPVANGSAVVGAGATSATEPSSSLLNPKALASTPYVYLIPVGDDVMRSPPLGDSNDLRTWSVQDATIPMPFNIGASGFSSKAYYQSADSLSESLFSVRKHQAFRPVSSVSAFTADIYGNNGALKPSQFTNRRLIGRSVWNTRWKLVIPGNILLNDPKEGLDRFIQTVKDVKLHFVTYSYSGN